MPAIAVAWATQTKNRLNQARGLVAIGLFSILLCGCHLPQAIEGGPDISDNVWLLQGPNATKTTGGFVPAACPKTETEATTPVVPSDLAKCVYAMINLIDVRYDAFENGLFKSSANTNFLADSAVLGISGAGAFFSGGAAQVMNGVTAGLTGFKSKFDQDILYSKTIGVLIQQMRSDRQTALNIIIKRLQATASSDGAVPPGSAAADRTQAASKGAQTAAQIVAAAVTGAAVAQPGASAADIAKTANNAVPAASTSGAATSPSGPLPYDNYYEAFADLHTYAIAGSWSHALISVETATAAGAEAAKNTVNATKTGTTPPAAPAPAN